MRYLGYIMRFCTLIHHFFCLNHVIVTLSFKSIEDESENTMGVFYKKEQQDKSGQAICSSVQSWLLIRRRKESRLWQIISSCHFQAIVNTFASVIYRKLGHPCLETICDILHVVKQHSVLFAELENSFIRIKQIELCLRVRVAVKTPTTAPQGADWKVGDWKRFKSP